jgi:hypothetical protein
MVMICPYCDIEINEKLVEAEDGCCPECGALITASTVINEEEDEFYDGDDAELGDDDGFEDELGGGSETFGAYDDAGGDEFKDEDY